MYVGNFTEVQPSPLIPQTPTAQECVFLCVCDGGWTERFMFSFSARLLVSSLRKEIPALTRTDAVILLPDQ